MRRPLLLALLVTLLAPAAPGHATGSACSSKMAVVDKHLTQYSCPGVHPGVSLQVTSEKYGPITCGASFAFVDQSKNRYLTMPGTCFLYFECLEDTFELPPPLDQLVPALPTCTLPADSEKEPYYKKNGPVVKDADGRRIGGLTYAVNKDGIDFAIVRLDPATRLDPSLPLYGGPTSMGEATLPPEEGYVYSPTTSSSVTPNARSGLLHASSPGVAYVVTEGVLAGSRGASAMKTNGAAIGVMNGYLTIGTGYDIQPFGPALERVERITKLKLRLLTAPLE
jgi:hypothetical protein